MKPIRSSYEIDSFIASRSACPNLSHAPDQPVLDRPGRADSWCFGEILRLGGEILRFGSGVWVVLFRQSGEQKWIERQLSDIIIHYSLSVFMVQ
jgi:hypothetical protein